MPPAVRIENLSKLYRIGTAQQARYRTLRETLVDAAAAPWKRWQTLRSRSRFAMHELNGHTASNGHAVDGNAGDCPNFSPSALLNENGKQNGTVPFGLANGHAGDCPDFVRAAEQGTDRRLVGTVPLTPAPRRAAPPGAFWALDDVSFDVEHGEVVGIIGRNGAGKSTLLKILSRITEPTSGRVMLNGRVASLLEVGTGFHPELTGRENIFLNGAVLGMRRHEIKRKFDAIVDFSGVETFLDTPVKRYSSGMYVRLAFAVAAHLDPEILVVDEVLAVGDAEFQKKCLGKMQDVARSGRTVLFVSHNMPAVQNLCRHAVLLQDGSTIFSGGVFDAITAYSATQRTSETGCTINLRNAIGRRRGCTVMLNSVALLSEGEHFTSVGIGKPIQITAFFSSQQPLDQPALGIAFKTPFGERIGCINNKFIAAPRVECPVTSGALTCAIPELLFLPGEYVADLYFGDRFGDSDIIENAFSLIVHNSDFYGTGRLPPPGFGAMALRASWEFSHTASETGVNGK